MGLDMYMYADKYVSAAEASLQQKSLPEVFRPWWNSWLEGKDIDGESPLPEGPVRLRASACYWRKANAIHGWLVRNVQDGIDECNEHKVSEEQLQELRALCVEALEKKDFVDGLQATEGFFFGSGEVQYFLDDCRDTIEQIDRLLKDYPGWTYVYCSSW